MMGESESGIKDYMNNVHLIYFILTDAYRKIASFTWPSDSSLSECPNLLFHRCTLTADAVSRTVSIFNDFIQMKTFSSGGPRLVPFRVRANLIFDGHVWIVFQASAMTEEAAVWFVGYYAGFWRPAH